MRNLEATIFYVSIIRKVAAVTAVAMVLELIWGLLCVLHLSNIDSLFSRSRPTVRVWEQIFDRLKNPKVLNRNNR